MSFHSFGKDPLKEISVSILNVKEKSRLYLCTGLVLFPPLDISQDHY